MARETKVGLIVGLAFIVCFAVILANRGQPSGLPSPSSHRMNGDVQVNRTTAPGADPTERPYPARVGTVGERSMSGNSTQLQPPAAMSPTSANAPQGFRGTPTSGGEVFLADGNTAAGGAGMTQFPMDGLPSPAVFSSPSTDQPGELRTRALPGPPTVPGYAGGNPYAADDRQRALEQHLQQLGSGSQTSYSGALPPGTSEFKRATPSIPGYAMPLTDRVMPALNPGPVGRTYAVAPGDTLHKIAVSQYGAKSTRVVNAIFDANRAVLSDRNRLKVGTLLTLPPIDGIAAASPAAAAQTIFISTAELTKIPPLTGKAAKVVSSKHPSKDAKLVATGSLRTFQWYQVRKNDRYASIAREFLGDTARWREIYELNKDKFPHPGQIREGVRIKLPVVARSDGRTRT